MVETTGTTGKSTGSHEHALPTDSDAGTTGSELSVESKTVAENEADAKAKDKSEGKLTKAEAKADAKAEKAEKKEESERDKRIAKAQAERKKDRDERDTCEARLDRLEKAVFDPEGFPPFTDDVSDEEAEASREEEAEREADA